MKLSKADIENHLYTNCVDFSYPWGKYSSRAKLKVAEAGYQTAVAGRHSSIHSRNDLLALPRINISKVYSLNDFKDIILGRWDYLGIFQGMKGL